MSKKDKHWIPCPKCSATGINRLGRTCGACKGKGGKWV